MQSLNQTHRKGQTNVGKQLPRFSLGFIILFLGSSLLFSSCRKKEKEEVKEDEDTEQNTATDNNLAENIAADIESMGSQVSDAGSLSTYRMNGSTSVEALEASACAAVSINGQTVTIDFGNAGCTGRDGRTRKGKLIYDFSGSVPSATRYRNPGFNMNVTSQNYTVDNYTVNILNKFVNNVTPNTLPPGVNPGMNLKWSIAANITIIKPANSGTITWSCSRTKELINTADTACYKGQAAPVDWTHAIVKLNGTANGVNVIGENYMATATDLVRDFNCAPDPVLRPHRHPFVSGIIAYAPGTRPVRTINFGNSACDLMATVTINGHVFNINLP